MPAAAEPGRKPVTLPRLAAMRERGERIAMLTCYDATFSALLDRCGVDVMLVGDSLGNVLQGHASTAAVRLDDMVYHTACVARGNRTAWIVADASWGAYHTGPAQAFEAAARLTAAGAHMVKLEGGEWLAPAVAFLAERGVPVCGHIGLTPQTAPSLGGFRVQGRDGAGAARLLREAKALEGAGASMLVLELVPSDLARTVTDAVAVPTIGIGAGPRTSGQVLVLHDMLGLTPEPRPRFVRDFTTGGGSVADAVRAYVAAVRDGSYPGPEHGY